MPLIDPMNGLIPDFQLKALVASWLQEDCPNYDVAGAVVAGSMVEGKLLGKASGILCGRPFVQEIFHQLDCTMEWFFEEGQILTQMQTVAIVKGEASKVLLGERTALNLLARASAIASK